MHELKWFALAGALLIPAAGYAQNSCKREGLQDATESYIQVQTKGARAARLEAMQGAVSGQPISMVGIALGGLPVAVRLGYFENFDVGRERLIDKAMQIDHHRSLLDTTICATFSEVIVTDKTDPYALGTRLHLNRGVEMELVWTTTGYSGLDADHYLKSAVSEDLSPLAPGSRDTHATLESIANIYMDALLQGKAGVEPWGLPCKRTARDGSCHMGLPVPAVNIANRHFVIDETMGAVVVICIFGADPKSGRIRTPDAHLFHVENGKVRFVHALTHLLQSELVE